MKKLIVLAAFLLIPLSVSAETIEKIDGKIYAVSRREIRLEEYRDKKAQIELRIIRMQGRLEKCKAKIEEIKNLQKVN